MALSVQGTWTCMQENPHTHKKIDKSLLVKKENQCLFWCLLVIQHHKISAHQTPGLYKMQSTLCLLVSLYMINKLLCIVRVLLEEIKGKIHDVYIYPKAPYTNAAIREIHRDREWFSMFLML